MMRYINKFSIGATAAIITSLALIFGLAHGDNTRINVIAGLLIIAIADNVADSLSIHILKESEGANRKEIYTSTLGNFFVRFFLALTFVLIIIFLSSQAALIVSAIWGLLLLCVLSYAIAKAQNINPIKETLWHLLIASMVIISSKLLGNLILHKIIY
jgi:VIT1/CCC1 family predicted Fe2+/Mn2+ transporter